MTILKVFMIFFCTIFLLEYSERSAKKAEERLVKNAIDTWLVILEGEGVVFPTVALAQILHETGTWKSKVFKENKNMFGMKESSRHYDSGTKNGHAFYKHIPHKGKCTVECVITSVRDYAAWQKQMMGNRQINTVEEYLYFLDHLPGNRRYAEDPDYTKKLRKYLNKINKCKSYYSAEMSQ